MLARFFFHFAHYGGVEASIAPTCSENACHIIRLSVSLQSHTHTQYDNILNISGIKSIWKFSIRISDEITSHSTDVLLSKLQLCQRHVFHSLGFFRFECGFIKSIQNHLGFDDFLFIHSWNRVIFGKLAWVLLENGTSPPVRQRFTVQVLITVILVYDQRVH